jgi:hypothetical protein
MQVERCFRWAGEKEKRLLAKVVSPCFKIIGRVLRLWPNSLSLLESEELRTKWWTGAQRMGICQIVQAKSQRKLKSVVWWAYVILGTWPGKSWPSQWCLAGLFRWSATLGLRHGLNSHGGSSGESWTMGESPIQQYRVSEEGQCRL